MASDTKDLHAHSFREVMNAWALMRITLTDTARLYMAQDKCNAAGLQ